MKPLYYISYPANAPIFTEKEVIYILDYCLQKNASAYPIITEIAKEFDNYYRFRKGDSDEMVLEGNQLFTEVLQKHFKHYACEDIEEEQEFGES